MKFIWADWLVLIGAIIAFTCIFYKKGKYYDKSLIVFITTIVIKFLVI